MPIDHGARDHSQWSASATERNWNCQGALALTDGLPEKTSEAADWGTCCHQISEKCLRDGITFASELIGTTEKGKVHEFEVDEEMADTAQVYVDFVRQSVIEAAPKGKSPADYLHIEQNFTLDALDPPFEAGGTADAVVYYPEAKLLHVVDLKGGRGHVVEVVGNPQLRTYALGAMLANSDLAVEQVRVTIVQPRAPHKSGRIRSEQFHVADLAEWTTDLVAAMKRSKAAMDAYATVDKPEGVTKAVWAANHLSAGAHCKFCKAAGFCPALEQKALDAVGVWFDDLDQPRISNRPDDLSPEELAKRLDMLDMIGEWVNAVRAYAHAQAESGVEIPGYRLVDKIGNRAWNAQEQDIVALLTKNGLSEDQVYTRKLVSPAQAEKALGAKRRDVIADWIQRPSRGTNLVAADKTSRPAAKPAVQKFFDVLE